jgi:hypothetical protein
MQSGRTRLLLLVTALAIPIAVAALGATLVRPRDIAQSPTRADIPTPTVPLVVAPTEAVYPTIDHRNLTLSDFDFLGPETSLNEVYARLGSPDRDNCSGIYCPEYDLADGRTIRFSTSNRDFLYGVQILDENGEVLEELSLD